MAISNFALESFFKNQKKSSIDALISKNTASKKNLVISPETEESRFKNVSKIADINSFQTSKESIEVQTVMSQIKI